MNEPRESISDEDKKLTDVVLDIYGCDENPLSYMIEPKTSIKIVDKKNQEISKEELKNIL